MIDVVALEAAEAGTEERASERGVPGGRRGRFASLHLNLAGVGESARVVQPRPRTAPRPGISPRILRLPALAAIMTNMFLTEPPPSAEVRAMYDRDLAEDGYVSNNTRLWGWRPDVFAAFKQARVTNGTAMTLSDREFAVVISATVAQRSDSYCSLAWGTNLASESTEDVAAAILTGGTPAALISTRGGTGRVGPPCGEGRQRDLR